MAQKKMFKVVVHYTINFPNTIEVEAGSEEDALELVKEIEPDVSWDHFWDSYTVSGKQFEILADAEERANGKAHEQA